VKNVTGKPAAAISGSNRLHRSPFATRFTNHAGATTLSACTAVGVNKINANRTTQNFFNRFSYGQTAMLCHE
jgi:hypothetical protein